MLPSGNDAATLLAEITGGMIMNERQKSTNNQNMKLTKSKA
jgi:hypothetical protein